MRSFGADADFAGLAGGALVAYVDVVAAAGEIVAGPLPERDIIRSCLVVVEGAVTTRGVRQPRCVIKEGERPIGGQIRTSIVILKRGITTCGIGLAG